MSFSLDSSEFERGLDRYTDDVTAAIKAGIVAAGDALLRDATDIVPFQKGFSGGLASTASKGEVKSGMSEIEIEVGFNKEYAARLHEDLSLNISQANTSRGQRRQQKYLEKPMKENGEKYVTLVGEVIRSRTQ